MTPRPLPARLWPLPDAPHTHPLPYGLVTEHPACLISVQVEGLFAGTTLSFHAVAKDWDPHGPFGKTGRQLCWVVRQHGLLLTPFRTTLRERRPHITSGWLPGRVASMPIYAPSVRVSLQFTPAQLAVLHQERHRVHATPSPYGGSSHA